jgi:2,3-bisphosphoglycerate-independent phosphoglycerate mutase
MRPVFLLVCDGWGHAPPSEGNAIALARTPIFDRWLAESPWTLLDASGESVGLPARVMGNSEVGHLTLGQSAAAFVERLENALRPSGGRIATVSGRYYAMDRDKRWDRVARAYAALVFSSGLRAADARAAIDAAYARGETDEFIQPTVIADGDEPVGPIQDGDAVVFFNFRADRARQLTRALTEPDFADFPRPKPPRIRFVGFTEYKKEFRLPAAFPPQELTGLLADAWSSAGLKNLRLAETEKYAHVTYFFNGGVEKAYPGEERVLVPSWKGATYDLHPQMSAAEVTEEAVKALRGDAFGAYVVNFANADMVGHTGKLAETISAVETLDRCFGILDAACRDAGAVLVMTADHGNAEQMIDPATGGPHTAHTTNPVPLVAVGETRRLLSGGTLADVAPTVLGIQGIEETKEMTGRDLRSS